MGFARLHIPLRRSWPRHDGMKYLSQSTGQSFLTVCRIISKTIYVHSRVVTIRAVVRLNHAGHIVRRLEAAPYPLRRLRKLFLRSNSASQSQTFTVIFPSLTPTSVRYPFFGAHRAGLDCIDLYLAVILHADRTNCQSQHLASRPLQVSRLFSPSNKAATVQHIRGSSVRCWWCLF
jgi:hypothetical protein